MRRLDEGRMSCLGLGKRRRKVVGVVRPGRGRRSIICQVCVVLLGFRRCGWSKGPMPRGAEGSLRSWCVRRIWCPDINKLGPSILTLRPASLFNLDRVNFLPGDEMGMLYEVCWHAFSSAICRLSFSADRFGFLKPSSACVTFLVTLSKLVSSLLSIHPKGFFPPCVDM